MAKLTGGSSSCFWVCAPLSPVFRCWPDTAAQYVSVQLCKSLFPPQLWGLQWAWCSGRLYPCGLQSTQMCSSPWMEKLLGISHSVWNQLPVVTTGQMNAWSLDPYNCVSCFWVMPCLMCSLQQFLCFALQKAQLCSCGAHKPPFLHSIWLMLYLSSHRFRFLFFSRVLVCIKEQTYRDRTSLRTWPSPSRSESLGVIRRELTERLSRAYFHKKQG